MSAYDESLRRGMDDLDRDPELAAAEAAEAKVLNPFVFLGV